MTSDDVRRRARADHDSIRQRVTRLELLASRILDGEASGRVRDLDDELTALRTELRGHLAWEDAESARLRGGDAAGEGSASRLRSAHDDLRAVLEFCRCSCGDENHPRVVAQRVHDLADLMRRTLDLEEQCASGSGAGRSDEAASVRPSGRDPARSVGRRG